MDLSVYMDRWGGIDGPEGYRCTGGTPYMDQGRTWDAVVGRGGSVVE